MKTRTRMAAVISLSLLVLSIAKAGQARTTVTKETKLMKVLTPSNMQAGDGPSEYFTGSVKVVSLVKGEQPSNLESASVTFQPGARSAWHTHPKGQLLIVTNGAGRIQEFGKPVRNIKVGDVIWTPPGVRHWHGASADSSMTHIATQESLNGSLVTWMEKVTDEQFNSKPE